MPKFLFYRLLRLAGALALCSWSSAAAAQSAQPVATDSSRMMLQLMQRGLDQMRAIYTEPDDARAAQLIDQAIREVGPVYARVQRYMAQLPPGQQEQFTALIQQQPWFRSLLPFSRSPAYRDFAARAARHPALQAAYARLLQTEYLQIQHHGGPAGSAPAGPRPL